MEAKKIIFLNQKGGVGKTTSTVNLGSALSKQGYKVLLIDFDAQCNLTVSVSGNDKGNNIYSLLTGQVSAKEAVQKTIYKNLDLIPGSLDLAGLNVELIKIENREFVLKEALKELNQSYDFILLDCPPSLGIETMNALVWCDSVIIPLQCEYLSIEGLNLIMRTITNIKRKLNPSIKVLGILFTMYSKKIKLNKDVVEDVTEFFPTLVFNTIIPRNSKISEAPSYGMPIDYYDTPKGVGTQAFKLFSKEVIERVNG